VTSGQPPRNSNKNRKRKSVSLRVQQYSLPDTPLSIDTVCKLSYTIRQDHLPLLGTASKSDQRRFLKDCKKTLELASSVEGWLKGWLLPSIIVIVNCMSVNLKLPNVRKLNSCLIVAPRGSGKGDLLERILAASNPNHFVVLPPKIFESELITKPKEFFHNKIIVLVDLIVTFEGMSIKQRQQLVNFFTMLLEGSYARIRNALANVSMIALLGLASEQLNKFRDELMSATFLERVPPFKHNVTSEMKKAILYFRWKASSKRIPTVRLPLPERIEDSKKIDVLFPRSKQIEDRIDKYALELDNYEVQSYARAQDYIKTFMRSNALLNGRSKVTKSDLYLYGLVHPLFLNSMGELGIEIRILSILKQNVGDTDNELIKKSGVSRGTFYKYKKILQGKDLLRPRVSKQV
jgi:hypothetical protein